MTFANTEGNILCKGDIRPQHGKIYYAYSIIDDEWLRVRYDGDNNRFWGTKTHEYYPIDMMHWWLKNKPE